MNDSETSESNRAGRSGRPRRVARSRSSSREVTNRRRRASTSDVVVQVSKKGGTSGKGKSRGETIVELPGPGSRSGRSGARDAACHPYATPKTPVASRRFVQDSNGHWFPRPPKSREGSSARGVEPLKASPMDQRREVRCESRRRHQGPDVRDQLSNTK